ncbi:MAG: hypothetical protein ACJA1A_002234 [Saprospiraceae bacterium]|jgi:hypothetical protein
MFLTHFNGLRSVGQTFQYNFLESEDYSNFINLETVGLSFSAGGLVKPLNGLQNFDSVGFDFQVRYSPTLTKITDLSDDL